MQLRVICAVIGENMRRSPRKKETQTGVALSRPRVHTAHTQRQKIPSQKTMGTLARHSEPPKQSAQRRLSRTRDDIQRGFTLIGDAHARTHNRADSEGGPGQYSNQTNGGGVCRKTHSSLSVELTNRQEHRRQQQRRKPTQKGVLRPSREGASRT